MNEPYYFVRLNKDVKPGTKGVYDALCMPITDGAPKGRKVRMKAGDAIKAAQRSIVQMLSPGGCTELLALAALDVDSSSEEEATRPTRKSTYKTRVQTADIES